MLKGSGMWIEGTEEQQRLFRKHTLLASIARMVRANLIEDTRSSDAILDDGYWSWVIGGAEGRYWAKSLHKLIGKYDWRAGETDIFRNLYESAIEKHRRHTYGEYYTPDWLANAIIEQVIDEEWQEFAISQALTNPGRLDGIGILDPACGSGTFLYHAARTLLKHSSLQREPAPVQARVISDLIFGMDVHPIAVEIAQVNLLRVLPSQPEHPLNINQGDSMNISGGGPQTQENSLLGNLWRWELGKYAIELPEVFVMSADFNQQLKGFVETAIQDKDIPAYEHFDDAHTEHLKEAHDNLKKITKETGNGVWSWYIRNSVAPKKLSIRKVDRIVANPPWVRMSNIQVAERKQTIIDEANRLNLWPGGKYATSFDIASIFIIKCEDLYLKSTSSREGKTGWLSPRASLSSGQWRNFREVYAERNPFWWNLSKVKEKPFTGTDSAVWFRGIEGKNSNLVFMNKISRTEGIWIDEDVVFEPGTIYLEEFDLKVVDVFSLYFHNLETNPSPSWFQGATLVPHVLVDIAACRRIDSETVEVDTSPSRHSPWNRLNPITGLIPKHWCRETVRTHNLLAYTLSATPSHTIIPTTDDGTLFVDPEIVDNQLWSDLESEWTKYNSKGARTPKTLLGQLDYNEKLSRQHSVNGIRVLYNVSGSILRSAILCDRATVVDSSIYWYETREEDEAYYLLGILNTDILQPLFKACREADRHFHLHIWKKVKIPRYNQHNKYHTELTRLARTAESLAIDIRDKSDPKGKWGQIKMSNTIREGLRENGISTEIDQVVAKILPEYI